jgi:predicted Holliday junction resolvase-like endonuclease
MNIEETIIVVLCFVLSYLVLEVIILRLKIKNIEESHGDTMKHYDKLMLENTNLSNDKKKLAAENYKLCTEIHRRDHLVKSNDLP